MGEHKYVGQDGALYNTFEEMMQADARYRQQERQNELIKEQNKLLKKQQIENELLEQQRHDNLIQALREETDRRDSDERARIENERIDRLFDDIGLNKRIYDNYIHSIFNPKEFGFESCEDYDLDVAIKDLNEIEKILDYDDERLSKYLSDKFEYGNLKEYHDSFTDYTSSYHLKEYILYESILKTKNDDSTIEQNNKTKSPGLYMIIGGFTLILFSLLLAFVIEGLMIFAGIGFIILFIGIFKLRYDMDKEESNKNNTTINFSLDTDIFKNELKSLIAEFKKEINAKKKSLKKKIQKYQEYLQEQADDFYNFRLNHYLPKLEKLLLDMKYDVFLKDYNINFKSVNKNNKVENGSIEDYIAYFEENTK